MNFGRTPPRLAPANNGMGSLWTKFRDMSNPVKQVQQSAQWTADVAAKIGFKPAESVANAFLKATTQVNDEVSRAGKNPALIKIVAVIVAAVLLYFGQVSLAASVIEMGQKYAKGVQLKKDLSKSVSEQKKDDIAGDLINSLIAYMPEADQIKIINAYNNGGYAALNNVDMIKILNTANGIKDISYLASVFDKLKIIAKNYPIDYYVHLAISQAVDIKINNAATKTATINSVFDYVKNAVLALPVEVTANLNNIFAASQGEGFKQDAVKAALMPIVKKAVEMIKTANGKAPYVAPKQTVFPMAGAPVTQTSTIKAPSTASIPAPSTPAPVTSTANTSQNNFKKYIPILAAVGLLLM